MLLALFTLGHNAFSGTPQVDGVKTVVIDAGHGGKDPGNLGTKRYKTTEKNIALAVALKLGTYIEQNFPDVTVLYTRKTDVFVDLKERANIANRAEADLFISIHCDAFTNSSVSGATSIVMGRNHDDDNLRVAMQENSVIYLEENFEEKYEGFDPNNPTSYIAFTLYQNAFMNQSVSFAQKVQNQFKVRVKRKDRGVKQQPLMVTKMATMPSALIELGFLTNPIEEDFLNSENGQSYMASAIYRAFKEYKEEREAFKVNTTPTRPASQPDVVKTEDNNPATKTAPNETETIIVAKQEVFYAVQIVTSGLKKELKPENFKGVSDVSYYQDKGLYKYIVGKADNVKSAETVRLEMKKMGFTDAFIIALANGKRVTIKEAAALLE